MHRGIKLVLESRCYRHHVSLLLKLLLEERLLKLLLLHLQEHLGVKLRRHLLHHLWHEELLLLLLLMLLGNLIEFVFLLIAREQSWRCIGRVIPQAARLVLWCWGVALVATIVKGLRVVHLLLVREGYELILGRL